MVIVNKVEIKNEKILNFLNKQNLCDIIDLGSIRKKLLNARNISDYHVSEEYAKEIINKGVYHDGYPEHKYLWNINEDLNKSEELMNFAKKLPILLCGAQMTAFSYYPPGGYIGWHNNANASGYNLILTWSKTGDGYFSYVNSENEFVKIKDKPGWSAKCCYFAPYTEPEKVCYHTAYTDCDRFTFAMIFDKNEELWKDIIYELSHNE